GRYRLGCSPVVGIPRSARLKSPSGSMATLVTPGSNERHWSVDVHLRRESDAAYVAGRSVRFARHRRTPATGQEVKIGAFVRLRHMIDVESGPAAVRRGEHRRHRVALRQLPLFDLEHETAPLDVEADRV